MSDFKLPSDDVAIQSLDISFRTHRLLKFLGCKTVGDVKRLTDLELKQTRGLGGHTFREIRRFCPYQADATSAAESKGEFIDGGKASEMTLRDYFAAQAMNGLVASWFAASHGNGQPLKDAVAEAFRELIDTPGGAMDAEDWLADVAYEVADGLLIRREM